MMNPPCPDPIYGVRLPLLRTRRHVLAHAPPALAPPTPPTLLCPHPPPSATVASRSTCSKGGEGPCAPPAAPSPHAATSASPAPPWTAHRAAGEVQQGEDVRMQQHGGRRVGSCSEERRGSTAPPCPRTWARAATVRGGGERWVRANASPCVRSRSALCCRGARRGGDCGMRGVGGRITSIGMEYGKREGDYATPWIWKRACGGRKKKLMERATKWTRIRMMLSCDPNTDDPNTPPPGSRPAPGCSKAVLQFIFDCRTRIGYLFLALLYKLAS